MQRIEVRKSFRLGKADYRFIENEGWRFGGTVDSLDIWYDAEESYMEVLAIRPDNKDVVARIVLNRRGYTSVWNIEMASVDSKYQGFGIMPSLYYWIMSALDVALECGEQQSPGGRGIWFDLADIPGVTVVAKRENHECYSYTERDEDFRELYCDGFELYGFDDVEMIAMLDR